jgi:hypothetical protein
MFGSMRNGLAMAAPMLMQVAAGCFLRIRGGFGFLGVGHILAGVINGSPVIGEEEGDTRISSEAKSKIIY